MFKDKLEEYYLEMMLEGKITKLCFCSSPCLPAFSENETSFLLLHILDTSVMM